MMGKKYFSEKPRRGIVLFKCHLIVKLGKKKRSKIRAELTSHSTLHFTTLTYRDAALTPASREQGEDEGERVSRLLSSLPCL
jgi:hypothetical protein